MNKNNIHGARPGGAGRGKARQGEFSHSLKKWEIKKKELIK